MPRCDLRCDSGGKKKGPRVVGVAVAVLRRHFATRRIKYAALSGYTLAVSCINLHRHLLPLSSSVRAQSLSRKYSQFLFIFSLLLYRTDLPQPLDTLPIPRRLTSRMADMRTALEALELNMFNAHLPSNSGVRLDRLWRDQSVHVGVQIQTGG